MRKDSKHSAVPVYSTETGRICPGCGKPVAACSCKQQRQAPALGGTVYVSRQTKGRKGKGVTLISGLPLAADALAGLAKRLKQKCGCGGTAKDGVIEIQGEQRQLLKAELEKLGYTVKIAGG